MKRKYIKKVIAAALVLTLVYGGAPFRFFSGSFGDTVTSVYAETDDNNSGASGNAPADIAESQTTIGDYTFSQDSSGNILVKTADDWNHIAELVKAGTDCEGCSFLMTNDLSITRPLGEQIGSDKNTTRMRFAGIFDGGGHTLDVSLNSNTSYFKYNKGYVSPFAYVKNFTVSNLRVTGTVTTTGDWASGLIGSTGQTASEGACSISNVQVSVELINNTVTQNGAYPNHGGIIGIAEGAANISDSWFDGKFSGVDYKHCGGFIGLNKGRATLTNCLFNPASIADGLDVADSCEFVHNISSGSFTLNECYSARFFGDPNNAQGIHVRSTYTDGDKYIEYTAADGNKYYYIQLDTPWKSLQNSFTDASTESIVLDKDYFGGVEDTCLTVPSGKTLTLDLNGHIIDRGMYFESPSADGCAIKVEAGGTLVIRDSVGGGVVMGGNNKGFGGGIHNEGSLTVEGGTIGRAGNYWGNKSTLSGGGIYNALGAVFTMTGGSVNGNSTTASGGNSFGGGIYITDGNVTLSGCSVTNNKSANSGGGIYVNDGTVEAAGCTVTGNKAHSTVTGGGVFLNSGVLTMNGGTVSGNTGTKESANGCGVYVKGGTFNVKGAVKIKDNTFSKSGSNAKMNAYLTQGAVINVAGSIKGSSIGVSRAEGKGAVTGGLGSYGKAENFVSDNAAYGVRLIDGEAALVSLYSVTAEESVKGKIELSNALAAAGDRITVTITAAVGYAIKSVSVNNGDVEVTSSESGSFTFTMTEGAAVVSARYLKKIEEKAPTYTEPGNIEYYTDEEDAYFVYENGQYVNTTADAVTIPELEKTDISSAVITVSDDCFTFDGTEKAVTYTAMFGDKELQAGREFTFEGDVEAIEVGVYLIKLKGIAENGYCGTATATWKIAPEQLLVTISGKPVKGRYSYYKAFTVSAPDPERGMKFSHWTVDGQTVSYSEKYSFIVKESVDLVPVYVSESNSDDPKAATLEMNIYKTIYNRKNAVRFIFSHNLPENYTVKEIGINYATNKLAGADTSVENYAKLNLLDPDAAAALKVNDIENVMKTQGSRVKQYIAKYTTINGSVSFSYSIGTNTDAFVYAIGYITAVSDSGEEKTFYTDLAATTYNNINSQNGRKISVIS